MNIIIKTINGQNSLVITIPLQTPTLSASGKTKIVANSMGPKSTNAQIDGKAITVNLSAWIK